MLEFGCEWACLVFAYTVDHTCNHFRLSLDFLEHESCVSWDVSAGIKPAELSAGRSDNFLVGL
jgi:hypothetical protein